MLLNILSMIIKFYRFPAVTTRGRTREIQREPSFNNHLFFNATGKRNDEKWQKLLREKEKDNYRVTCIH